MEFKGDMLPMTRNPQTTTQRAGFLPGVAACLVAASAHCLTITPTFDSSISDNPTDGPAMIAAINAAIQVFETNYADTITINITFMVDTSVSLAQSDNSFAYVNYTAYRAALKSRATSANDALALSHLPATSTDPVIGGTQMLITVPLASVLGLTAESPNGAIVRFNTNLLNLTRPNPNNDNFDMQSAMEHEIDEILGGGGAGCNLDSFPQIGALDLFRYATNSANAKLARTWTLTNGDNAYFSVDGTNLWVRFNGLLAGDLGDFWGFNQDPVTYLPLYWSPPGVTPHAEVQDAYSTASYFSYPSNFTYYPTTNYYYEDTSPDLGTNELTMLDVIGWTLASAVAHTPAPAISIVHSAAHQITLSWVTNATTFTLQESSNLTAGSWVAAATGTKTPAVITIAGGREFFRLQDPTALLTVSPVGIAAKQPSADSRVERAIHVWLPPTYATGLEPNMKQGSALFK